MKAHESYVVKIYHRNGGDSQLMIGEVESPDGKKSHPFRTAEELWWILLTESGETEEPTGTEPNS